MKLPTLAIDDSKRSRAPCVLCAQNSAMLRTPARCGSKLLTVRLKSTVQALWMKPWVLARRVCQSGAARPNCGLSSEAVRKTTRFRSVVGRDWCWRVAASGERLRA